MFKLPTIGFWTEEGAPVAMIRTGESQTMIIVHLGIQDARTMREDFPLFQIAPKGWEARAWFGFFAVTVDYNKSLGHTAV